ncbi:oligosaccharide flippase family protein [Dorea sp. YH-dor228]|uniref:lipopolysaccharide biosynthesis protein n=1 Tax=Dorea sp. YH-dor228 TaxID=3151120 RepID=UPI0032420D25
MKSKSSKFKSNGNIAFQAGIWYVISSIMVKMVSVITTPIFTRILSTDDYGTVATFSSWYSMFLVIYSLNLSVSIGRAKIDYPDKLDEYIGSIQTLSFIVSLGLSAIIVIFISPLSRFFELSVSGTFVLLLYLISAPTISFVQSGYRYKYKYKQNIAIAWYITLSTVFVSLLLIKLDPDNKALMRMLGIAIPSILLSLYFWVITIKKHCFIINLEYWRYGLNISVPMILHAVSMNILAQSDRIVISKFDGPTQVAFYSLIRNYALLLFVITDAINQAWLPWFHDNYHLGNVNEIRENTKSLVILTCYIGLACISIGPEAILLLGGEQYSEAIVCLMPMVLGVVCQCIYTHYINIELHKKKTKYASQGTVIAATTNIVLNLIFVPLIGYQAAAYTTFASYLLLLVLHCYITHKKLGISLYDDKFLFGAIIITSVISFGVSLTYETLVLRYIIICIGFISFLFVFRNHIFVYIKKIERKK